MYSVLFICTANICRSPMAQGLLRARVSEGGESHDWRIESAGVWALPEQPAALFTRQVLQERGIGLGNFRSRPISRELLAEFNLVLTMERGHKEALRAAFPEFAGRIFMMRELIGDTREIADPVGNPIEDYRDTAKEMENILIKGYDRLRKLAADAPAAGAGRGLAPAGS
jgi:protein-tyrosine-phosphatase